MTSKFIGISYPFFGLKKKPYKVSFTDSKVLIEKTKGSHTETVDDRDRGGNDYFARLVAMPVRLEYDMTCANLQDVLYAKPKWGLDKRGGIFDLTKKEVYKSKVSRIKTIKDKYFYVTGVAYPFRLKTNEKIKLDELPWVQIVYIDNVWYAKEFLTDYKDVNSIRI